MGAACTCMDKRETVGLVYYPLRCELDNEAIFGLLGYEELGETECDPEYRNSIEVATKQCLTRSTLTEQF